MEGRIRVSLVPVDPLWRRLSDVAAFLDVASVESGESIRVAGIAQHSGRVRPGNIYLARPGMHAHGAGFAQQAASAGATAAVTDEAGLAPCQAAGLSTLVVPDPGKVAGKLSAWMYGEPTNSLTMLGVTGTNGKTTTTYLLDAALSRVGHRTGLIGTVETRMAGEQLPSGRTTPEAPELQGLLAAMVQRGVDAVSMEVSSHALDLARVDGTRFAVVGFTNLSQDHLELHGDLESYYQAKARLFDPEFAKVGVVNVDDPYGARLATEASERKLEIVTVSPSGAAHADWRAGEVEYGPSGSLGFDVIGPEGAAGPGLDVRIAMGLAGDFNVANALVAVAMLDRVGVDAASIVAAFAGVRLPGRMERILPAETERPGQSAGRAPVNAIVDYAHTPEAIDVVLRSVRRGAPGRIIAVFGSGGDRDVSKRPLMGAAVARGADVAVITDDNPRSEDPAAIRSAVRAGARGVRAERAHAEVMEIGDRREAIFWAIRNADPGDTVLVLGKGHETGQEVRGVLHPFDDRAVTASALAELAAHPEADR